MIPMKFAPAGEKNLPLMVCQTRVKTYEVLHASNLRFIFSNVLKYCLSLHCRVFEKSLQYVKRFSRYKNPDAVRQVREYP